MDPSRFLLLFFCLSGSLSAQPTIEWQKSLGGSNTDQAEAICSLPDGRFLVAGNTRSTDGDVFGNHGGTDIWLVNLSSIGNVQWKKAYGGSGNDDVYSIQQTRDRGYVMAGRTLSNNWDVSGNNGDNDAWVVKLDSFGGIQWQKCFGGSGWEEAKSIKQTEDGGYIFVGFSTSADGDVTLNQGSFDFWIVKLDSTGNVEWQKPYGGSGEDMGNSVSLTSDGGYIVSGQSESNNGNVTGNHGSLDFWVLKLNSEGKIEWQKSFGGPSIDRAIDIHQSFDAGYIVIGQSYSNSGDVSGNHGYNDFWVVKLNKDGALEWQKSLGGSNEDYAASITQTHDGGYVMTGQTQSNNGDVFGNDGGADVWVVKLDSFGNLMWERTFGGTMAEWGNSIQLTIDGGFIIAGHSRSSNGDLTENQGSDDYWVIKLSPESSPTTNLISTPITIYPNPAHNTITLSLPTQESDVFVTITDLLGRELRSQMVTIALDGTVKLDIATLPESMYLVSATTPSGQVFFGKVLKQE
jgi:hypothetical protein